MRPKETRQISFRAYHSCQRATVRENEEYFIPDRAKGPFPLQAGQELWVEVTIPPSGPPRPIQLAVSDTAGFKALRME